ncbi:hypothetical protein [Allomuricauda sp. F6463D]|uniref:hypothetical protein n=1 Tax=Allomuricauda sp. F6463D TaxID=2926409 RepID=UPI001FF401FE|nr:hypothetical protein [Muricauda sp. F6463D]MCK0160359.1 hypothetical protein [Muricauda sp. F6463D]
MELGTIIIGLLIIALCALPFIFMARGRKRKQKELLDNLKNIAESNNTDIGTFDFGPGFVIGLSSAKNYVLFYKKKKEQHIEMCIPINTLRKCEVKEAKQSVAAQKGKEEIINKLELVCYSNASSNSNSFEFYNADDFLQLNGELQLAKKWENMVKEAMELYRS